MAYYGYAWRLAFWIFLGRHWNEALEWQSFIDIRNYRNSLNKYSLCSSESWYDKNNPLTVPSSKQSIRVIVRLEVLWPVSVWRANNCTLSKGSKRNGSEGFGIKEACSTPLHSPFNVYTYKHDVKLCEKLKTSLNISIFLARVLLTQKAPDKMKKPVLNCFDSQYLLEALFSEVGVVSM